MSPTAITRSSRLSGRPGRPLGLLAAAGAATLVPIALTPEADATWSIVVADTRTGEVVAASATCLLGFDLRDNTPVILHGIGAATAQSAVDQTSQNRTRVRDGLLDGLPLGDLLADLEQFDGGHQNRQYGVVTVDGEALTFSGADAAAYAGGVTGTFGPLVYAIQGNILTGEPVVLEAEIAMLDALAASEMDGTLDLPGAVMAGMEAARAQGGDGRCSCDQGPTGCGTPPPEPFVSSYIAYAIVARAGDTDVCNAAYPGPPSTSALALGDLNGDGLTDAVVSSTSGFVGFDIMMNVTPDGLPGDLAGDLPPRFESFDRVNLADRVRDVELVDLNGDARLDIVGPSDSTGGVVVSYQLATGFGFDDPVTFGTGTPANNRGRTIATGDFDGVNGPDVAVADGRADRIRVFLNDGTGALVEGTPVGLGLRYRDLRAADLTGDGRIDLAVASDVGGRVLVYEGDGAGGFTNVVIDQAIGGSPRWLAVADLNDDSMNDLIVGTNSSNDLTLFTPTGHGNFVLSTVHVGFAPDGLAPGDLNQDGIDDVFVFGGSNGSVGRSLIGRAGQDPVLRNNPADLGGGNVEAAIGVFPSGPATVFASPGAGGLKVTSTADDGTVLAGDGCGNGDYYLSLNVAGGNPNAPDPIVQLQDLFDADRETRRQVTDAVRTVVEAPTGFVSPTAGATIRVRARDWNGDRAVKVVDIFTEVISAEGVTGVSASAVNNGNGLRTVTVTADPGSSGTVTVRLIVDDAFALAPVELMPSVTIHFRPSVIDFDDNGLVTIFDLIAFLQLFDAMDPVTDLNDDGTIDVFDIVRFLELFDAGR